MIARFSPFSSVITTTLSNPTDSAFKRFNRWPDTGTFGTDAATALFVMAAYGRLRGERVYWRPSQYWCGDWIVNQSRIASNSRTCLRQKLKKQQLLPSRGMVVKDIYGRIVSNNPKLPHVQSKLRLLALDTQLSNDTSSGDVQASAMIVDMAGDKKMVSRGHLRIVGAQRRSKMTQTTKECAKWTVIDARAALPNEWSSTTTTLSLESDQVQGFPVVWIRPLSEPTPPSLDDIDISKKNPTLQNLLQAIIQTLADKRAINAQDVFGRTLMHHAAVYGHYRLLDVLLAEHALVHVTDSQHNTPLHVAASRNKDVIIALLAGGANPSFCRLSIPSPTAGPAKRLKSPHLLGLYWKRRTGTTVVIEHCVECLIRGWAIKLFTPDSATYFDLFKLFLQTDGGWSLHSTDCTNQPMVHHVVARLANNPSIVVQCLEELAKVHLLSINHQDPHGNTLLLQECKRVCFNKTTASLAVVRSLLHHGANLHLANNAQESPMQCAAFFGHDALLELLLDTVTPDFLAKSAQVSNSPLHLACLGGHVSTIQILLSCGAVLNGCAEEPPLCYGIRSGKPDVVQFLLHRGAEVNIWCPLARTIHSFGHVSRLYEPVDMGSPLTLLLHLVPSRVFQLPTYDVPPTQPELLAENQHIYLSKQELAHRYNSISAFWHEKSHLLQGYLALVAKHRQLAVHETPRD
ncbi:hypothetical protein DYB32_000924 [Aphanomyces invadans]|uniref:Uncharacterized protein n=1 Tax=Aphanomyces invadans TaxID=157072 RepID=A0A3R6VHD3_9STRA|nr:hypothetical protein DYB32_000924 [Aphanomyces invadans]